VGIAHYGNKQRLLQKKKFLRQEVETNTLGSPPAAQILQSRFL
jgi:lariat debranching enzyme